MFSFATCLMIFSFLSLFDSGHSIKCYQCSSGTDPKGVDSCGAYAGFHKDKNIPVDCSSEESVTPGTFCMKETQQGPKGFIWDGRWRQVIRRCASVAETGVTGVCNWGVRENGIYWEQCYCSEDGCNSGQNLKTNIAVTLVLTLFVCHLEKIYTYSWC